MNGRTNRITKGLLYVWQDAPKIDAFWNIWPQGNHQSSIQVEWKGVKVSKCFCWVYLYCIFKLKDLLTKLMVIVCWHITLYHLLAVISNQELCVSVQEEKLWITCHERELGSCKVVEIVQYKACMALAKVSSMRPAA